MVVSLVGIRQLKKKYVLFFYEIQKKENVINLSDIIEALHHKTLDLKFDWEF